MRGSCLCGAVRFAIDPPLARFAHCYCARCRKGTGRASNAVVEPAQLRWLDGDDCALPDLV